MTKDEYNILFHKEQLNLVAFKRLMDCEEEVLRLINRAVQEEREACAKIVDVQNMASKSTYKKQLETKNEPVAIVTSESGANVTHSWWHEPALPIGTKLYTSPQRTWVGLTKEDMPDGENPMFDHKYFIAGMVYANNTLLEKNI